MVWWIVAGLVAVPLLVLAVVVATLRRRLAELDRVAALARERAAGTQTSLQASAGGMQATLAGVGQRVDTLQKQLAERKAGRTGPGPGGGKSGQHT